MPQGKQCYEAIVIMNYSQQRCGGEKGSVMSEGVSENRTRVSTRISSISQGLSSKYRLQHQHWAPQGKVISTCALTALPQSEQQDEGIRQREAKLWAIILSETTHDKVKTVEYLKGYWDYEIAVWFDHGYTVKSFLLRPSSGCSESKYRSHKPLFHQSLFEGRFGASA